MAENRFLQSPFDQVQQDAPSLDLPSPVASAAPSGTAPDDMADVRQPSRAMSKHGLMLPQDLQPIFEAAAAKEGVPVNVLAALAAQESNYNPNAVGEPTKWGRAKGMLQNLDSTAKGLGINPFNAEESIFAAARQMRERLDKGDSMEDVVKAHFGGDNRKQWGSKTAAYGREVLQKAGVIGDGLMGQQPAQDETPAYDLKAIQAELDAKEPGRFRVVDPSEIEARDAKRTDIASGTSLLNNAMDGMKRAPSPLTPENQQAVKAQGAPSPLTMTNQIRVAAGLQPNVDPVQSGSGAGSYLKKSAVAGMYDVAGAAAKVLDAVNPWTFTESEIATIFKDNPQAYKDYMDNSAGMILNRFSKAMTKKSEETMGEISPEAKASYGDLEYATTDADKSALLSPVKVIGDAVRSLPSTVALAVTAYVTRGAAQRAEAQALAAGATPEVARQVGIKAGMKTMAQTGAVSEGAIGYGQQANQTFQAADKAAVEKSPRYQGLLQEGYTPETARAKIVADTAEESGKYAGIVDASVNLVGGEFLGKIISEGGPFISRVMKGVANEAATETVQSAGEQVGQNLATQNNIDPNQSLSQGVGEAAVQGAAVGGLTGGAVAGALGGRRSPPAEAAPRVEPTIGDPQADPAQDPAAGQPAPAPEVPPVPAPAAPPAGPLTRAAEAAIIPEAAPEPATAPAPAPEAAPKGESVTVRAADGDLPGTLESYQEDGSGNWSARVVAEDGNAYDFTQDDGVTLDRAAPPTPTDEVENALEPIAAPDGEISGVDAPEAGSSDAPAPAPAPAPAARRDLSTATVPELRSELKLVAAELRADRTNADLKARRKEIEQAINAAAAKPAEPQADQPTPAADALAGEKINKAWTKFAPDSGTLNIPRADMPQIKAEHRGAMVNFLNARGIASTQEEVPASTLKPTQQEFSPAKVKKAIGFKGGDRSILVSSDGHVLDGHHQWMAKLNGDQPVKVIRLDAPISQLLDAVRDFPSSTQASGATQSAPDVKLTGSDVKESGLPVKEMDETVKADTATEAPVPASEAPVPASEAPVPASEAPVPASVETKTASKPEFKTPKQKALERKVQLQRKAREQVGVEEGERFTMSGDIGYASAGKTYTLDSINTDGSVDVTSDTGSTSLSRAELQRAKIGGVVFTPVEKAAAKPEPKPEESSVVSDDPTGAKNARVQSSEYGANNKLVSQDRAAELRAKLKAKLNGSQLNAGIDPEVLALGTELAVFHIEAGVRKFADFAKTMAADLDMPLEKVRPYLRSWYNGARDMTEDAGQSIDGMDGADTVRAELAKLTDATPQQDATPPATPSEVAPAKAEQTLEPGVYTHDRHPEVTATVAKTEKGFSIEWAPDDVQEFRGVNAQTKAIAALTREGYMKPDEANNAAGSRRSMERDRPDAEAAQPVDERAVPDEPQRDGRGTRVAGRGADAERNAGQRDQRLPADGAAARGERGDQLVHQPDGQFRSEDSPAGSAERTGSGSDSVAGTAVEQERASDVVADAPASDSGDLTRRIEAQRKADKSPTKWGDKASIDDALPLLLPEQRGDVLKAEQRHAVGNGMLHTNGTGTGKTASGLGLAKRFINDGKDNIVIVVPSDKIASDWVKFGGMMGIDLKQLTDTKDNGGSGPVITTYANFAANESLAQRDWDLAITDEAHYLSSNEAGETTGALEQLRALTGHHSGFNTWAAARFPKERAALNEAVASKDQASIAKASAAWEAKTKPEKAKWDKRWTEQSGLPKTLFLSATPFPYVKNVDYAEGYLFDYVKPADLKRSEGRSGGYNSGSPREQFFMQHFGYRMRTNKLTAPEAGVDSELMEQNFNQWLKDTGALSGRRLEVPFDYDRKFAVVDDAVGQKIDEGLKFLREEGDGKYRQVYDSLMKQFDYQRRMYLLESIKARAVVPMIKEHMKLGRKVVVFHDYNKGGGFDPFADGARQLPGPTPSFDKAGRPIVVDLRALAAEAFAARPDLFKLDLKGLQSPIATLSAAFPDALMFNGTVPKRARRANADAFNDDAGDKRLMVVQSDAGREGVSLHDTTGKSQRVLINLGMPGKPVAAIQIEGRTYRTGQASDAIFRYLTTGTAWEASAFASKIAERASTAENLALGTEARGLKQSFVDAYNNADLAPASAEDGKGGKAYDRNMSSGAQLSGFTKAKTFYFAQQKNTRRRDQREGVDYFATPEPVGFKMVEWSGAKQGDDTLEPSAGHGAIARFFPPQTNVTMVEPSYELSQRAALANGNARIVNEQFEDLHLTNKYDAIVMNPPYGSGGKTAIEHVAKAVKHVRDGGRVVALIPRGGLADKRLETFLASPDAADMYMVADIQMPTSAFERAGTAVSTHVIVLERHTNPADAEGIQQRNIDLSNEETIGDLFNRIEDIGLPDRKPSSKPEPKETIVEHTTGKGKVLRGVIRQGLTRDEAKEIDPFTFKKDGGYFIRSKYLDQAKQSVDAYKGFNADVDGAKFSVQPDGLRSLVEAEPLDLFVAPELAARPLAEVRAEGFANMLANRSTTMSHPSVGTITFNRAGITKSRSTSNDPAKVMTLGQLDEIVSEAAYLGRSEPEGDAGNVVRHHYLGRRLTVDGEPMMAMITLRENADGKISYYNHSMLQDAPTIESIVAPTAANDNAKYQRPTLRMERMSLSDGTSATPGQSDRIRETLTSGQLGKGISRLIDSGRIVLHDTVQSLPGQALPGTQAMTMPDGTIHLVVENLTPQTAMPVMLHEMFHSGGEALVGGKRWGELQGRLASLHRQFAKSPGKAGEFYAAAQRVKDAQAAGNAMSEGLTAEEFGAYAIEQYESAPASIRKWVDDVVGAIKEYLFRKFGIQLGQVSPSQLRAMAVEAIRAESSAAPAREIAYSLRPSESFDDLNGDQKSFLDKIGPQRLPQIFKDRWAQLTDNLALRIRQAGVDRYAALLRNDKALHGEDTLEGSIASSSWVLARMSPSAGGALSALLNNGRIYLDADQKVIDIKEGTEGLGATLRKLGRPVEIDRFMGWIAANRAKRLLGEGRENLFTPEEIEAGIKLSGGKLENGKSRSILYAQAWKEFQRHRDDVLGIAEGTGIITPEQRQTWSEEFYVPFYRVMDEENLGGPSSGSGISRQQAYKKLKGGKQHLNDLLDNTLLNFHHLLQASLKNQAAAQAMVNAEALAIAEKTTETRRDKKLSTFVMVDGVKQWYNVSDPLTFKAVSALADAGLNNPAMRLGRAFKRFFTNMTTLTPQFVVANAIRDTLAAMSTSPTSFVPLKTAIKGALTYGNDMNKARMMASGGAFSFGHVYGQNANEVKAALAGSMRTAQVLTDPKLIPNVLLGAWRKYKGVTDFVENINRAGIWEHNEHRGKLKASFEARDLMDFSAHGDATIVRIMTDLVPFLNARIQGLDKLYRAGGKPAIKTLFGKGSKSDKQSFGRFMAVVGALTAMSALLYLRNKDDEDYRKLEDWQRDTYWPIKIGDSMFFIPKPFEVGAIATMGERLLEQFVDPTVGGVKLASRMGHMLTDTFAFNPIPQVVKPLYELGANENTFTGRPIEDQSMKRLSPSLRTRPETSRLADAASRGIETSLGLINAKNAALSPVQIDHLIQGYAGAVGATAVGMADTIWRRASGEELPARRWSEYQPIKRFYKDLTQEDNYTRYGTDFYEALKKSDQSYADLQHLIKYGQDERALALSEKDADKLALRSSLTKVSRSMSKINAEMKRIQMDKDMSGEAKRLELDRMRSMRNLMTEEMGKALEREKMLKRASDKP